MSAVIKILLAAALVYGALTYAGYELVDYAHSVITLRLAPLHQL